MEKGLKLLFLLDDHGVDQLRRSDSGGVNFFSAPGGSIRPFSGELWALLADASLRAWLAALLKPMPRSARAFIEADDHEDVEYWSGVSGS